MLDDIILNWMLKIILILSAFKTVNISHISPVYVSPPGWFWSPVSASLPPLDEDLCHEREQWEDSPPHPQQEGEVEVLQSEGLQGLVERLTFQFVSVYQQASLEQRIEHSR